METEYVLNTYNKIANEFSNKRVNKWDWITSYISNLPKYSNILDIGCGNGRNMEYKDYNFIGIDNCDSFIDICKNKNLNVIKSDMTNLPFKNNYFDSIISIASFHHLATIERREQTLQEMKRILKHNGTILLSVWSINQSHNKKLNFTYGNNIINWNNEKRYYYIFEKNELKDLLEKYFIILNWDYNHGNEIITLQLN
jgi:SAM-dependent methyltransferase